MVQGVVDGGRERRGTAGGSGDDRRRARGGAGPRSGPSGHTDRRGGAAGRSERGEDVTHLRDRVVGEEFLHIALGEGPDHGNDRSNRTDPQKQVGKDFRVEDGDDAHHGEEGDLDEDAREHGRNRMWRVGVGLGEPGVKRDEGGADTDADYECDEGEAERSQTDGILHRRVERGDVGEGEGAELPIDHENPEEEEENAHRAQDEILE